MSATMTLLLVTSVLTSLLAGQGCRHGSWQCRGDNTCILRENVGSHQCVLKYLQKYCYQVCDSTPDCPDQSDEDKVCRFDSAGRCPDFMFTCPGSGQCISQVNWNIIYSGSKFKSKYFEGVSLQWCL